MEKNEAIELKGAMKGKISEPETLNLEQSERLAVLEAEIKQQKEAHKDKI